MREFIKEKRKQKKLEAKKNEEKRVKKNEVEKLSQSIIETKNELEEKLNLLNSELEKVRSSINNGNSEQDKNTILISNQNEKSENQNQTTFAPSKIETSHIGITCDDCKIHPIVGKRYKCLICNDFDLCETCESKNDHVHPMIRCSKRENNEILSKATRKFNKMTNRMEGKPFRKRWCSFRRKSNCGRFGGFRRFKKFMKKNQTQPEQIEYIKNFVNEITESLLKPQSPDSKESSPERMTPEVSERQKYELIEFIFGKTEDEDKLQIRKEFVQAHDQIGLEEFHKKLVDNKNLF